MESVSIPAKRVAEILEMSKDNLFNRTSFDTFKRILGMNGREILICPAIDKLHKQGKASKEETQAATRAVWTHLYDERVGEYYGFLVDMFLYGQRDTFLAEMAKKIGWGGVLRTKYYIAKRNEWLDDLIFQIRRKNKF